MLGPLCWGSRWPFRFHVVYVNFIDIPIGVRVKFQDRVRDRDRFRVHDRWYMSKHTWINGVYIYIYIYIYIYSERPYFSLFNGVFVILIGQ